MRWNRGSALCAVALVLSSAVGMMPPCSVMGDEPIFEIQQVYQGQRFPNVVVTPQGTVLAFRAQNAPMEVRRSEDGGVTWGPIIQVSFHAAHMGAAVVDDHSGDVFAFNHFIDPEQGSAHRSRDDGKTWEQVEVAIHPNRDGSVGVTHGSDSGITLQHGEHAGRLIIASRSFGPHQSNDRSWWPYHTTQAIYSDDGGQTWQTSDPFPVLGTGESMLAELSDGRLYYNTRSHTATDALRRIGWSHDGGQTWVNPQADAVLPDEPRSDAYGLMGGLTRVPHDEYDLLVYSNVDEPGRARQRLTVWLSIDGGQTWPIKRLVHEGPSAYSSLAMGREGTLSANLIFLQFEGGTQGPYEGLYVARFNLEWLLDGKALHDFE